MSEKYFQNFPKIYYDGKASRNIILKSKFFREVLANHTSFYPYLIKDDDRPDLVAFHYYGRWEYEWLVYMSNDIVDPYYGWPLDQRNFDAFIVGKYGSYEDAISLDNVIHYVYNQDVDLKDNTIPEGIRDRYTLELDYHLSYQMSKTTWDFLPAEEKNFWLPVNAHAWEVQKNEDKRSIRLLDNRLLGQIDKEIAKIFR